MSSPFPPSFGQSVGTKCSPKCIRGTWNFIDDKANIAELDEGKAFYAFTCSVGTSLGTEERRLISSLINLSSYKDEMAENGTPKLNLTDPKDLSGHVYLLNKAMYVLPHVGPDDVSPQLLSSVAFQKACQPGMCKVWEDVDEHDTFRLTKTIVRAVYKVTIQFKCSWVEKDHLSALEVLSDGLPVHQAILLERTKRDKTYQDSTVKAKSVLLYHVLPKGGMLVTNVTCVANSSLPTVVAKLVDKLGWSGASEVAETAEKTRAHMLSKHPAPAKKG